MVTNDKALKAFKIDAEDPRLRDAYGRHDLGQSCLLARRLVEAGVTYVTIQAGGGWDTHGDTFTQLKDRLLPKYDRPGGVGDRPARSAGWPTTCW